VNPNPKPEVVTNRAGDDTANALSTYWSHLLGALREPPDLAIATAYFNAAGFSLLAEPLERMRRVRLLIGAEPDVAAELRRVRPLRQDLLPDDVPRERVRAALSEHERDLAADRDLDPFDPEVDATSKRLIAWLRSGRVEVRRLTDRFLHGKAYIVETAHDGVMAGSSNLTFAGLTRNDELNLGHYQPHVVGEVVSWFEDLWGAAQPFDLAALYERRSEPHDPHVVYLRRSTASSRVAACNSRPSSATACTARWTTSSGMRAS
jgi:phosphatidylserine/phosphatidylglycerophosphate/cardiolipin synthase-like enzyme